MTLQITGALIDPSAMTHASVHPMTRIRRGYVPSPLVAPRKRCSPLTIVSYARASASAVLEASRGLRRPKHNLPR